MSAGAGVRPFVLFRDKDESGVSGTGFVAVGVQLPTGRCVMEWLGEVNSITIHDTVDQLIAIHGHNGRTRVIWDDSALSAED